MSLESNPQPIPASLLSSLSTLQTHLSPYFPISDSDSTPLPPSWSSQTESLPPLERARLNVTLAYTLIDLVWVYLKTKGIDPDSHPVSIELERVRGYFEKIREIEEPSQRKTKLDIPAAGRFIKHGIPRAQRLSPPSSASAASTSAAQAAKTSAERAVAEQDKSFRTAERWTAERWKFLARDEDVEDVGQSDSGGNGEPFENDDDTEGEEEELEEGAPKGEEEGDEAEDLLAEIQGEIDQDGEEDQEAASTTPGAVLDTIRPPRPRNKRGFVNSKRSMATRVINKRKRGRDTGGVASEAA